MDGETEAKKGRVVQGPREDLGLDRGPQIAGGWGGECRPDTHGPDSTWMEPTFSSRLSVRLGHSAESSHRLPWKFSSSYTITWKNKVGAWASEWLQGRRPPSDQQGGPTRFLLAEVRLTGLHLPLVASVSNCNSALNHQGSPRDAHAIFLHPIPPSKASACLGRDRTRNVTLLPSASQVPATHLIHDTSGLKTAGITSILKLTVPRETLAWPHRA